MVFRKEFIFRVLSDVCLWCWLTHSCTAFPGEPRVAGDEVLFRVSQVCGFLDSAVLTCAQRISAESRKSLDVFKITVYLYPISSCTDIGFEYFKCINKYQTIRACERVYFCS